MMHKLIWMLLLATLTHTNARWQTVIENRKKHFNVEKKGLALAGYDPVAYLTTQKALKGQKDINFLLEGIIYQFANTRNRDIFKADATKFEPQYGGWCAFAMGDSGEKVAVDPETFKLINGKLYLFYNSFFNNTKKSWDKDEARLKAKADINWNKTIQNN